MTLPWLAEVASGLRFPVSESQSSRCLGFGGPAWEAAWRKQLTTKLGGASAPWGRGTRWPVPVPCPRPPDGQDSGGMHGARALPWELCFPAGSVCSGLPGAPGWPRLPVWAPCGLRPRWPAPSPAPCGWVQPLRPRCPHRGWGGEAFRTRPRLPLGSFHPGLSCGRLLLAPGAQARAPRPSQGPRSHGAPAILCPGLTPFSLSW